MEQHPIGEALTAVISMREKTPEDSELIKSCLQTHQYIVGLTDSDIEEIIPRVMHFSMEPNQTVFTQGEPANYFYIIASGEVQVILNNKPVATMGRGKTFGELALKEDLARLASITTITQASFWVMDKDTFKQALRTLEERRKTD